ncbi:MAG TPA: protein kinase, partial [Thermoanaerobaculia bacterium]|nr:protein kinase [Thermoanaerobaculia bacterium]
MGEVYRARDPRLARDVAIKVLPEEFFEGEERRQRFEREARLLAALNHPGIAAIYSFEEIPSFSSPSSRHVLVMELVEGDDLAVRLSSGPLPLDESLSLARQIAEALEAAHDKGIVHRDLKPANVKVTPEGRVKLLDFGLAKVFEGDAGPGSAPSVTHSPTLTARATAAGVILGTAAYMSPEQARGKPLDKRTDVWAFGCVLFEMLTGKRAFDGETVTDVLAAVLTKEPDWAALPAQTPGAVKKILRRCLQRDARLRLHDIADARLDLDELSAAASSSSSAQLPFEENLHPASPSPTVASAERASRERGSRKSLSFLLPWALAAAFAAALGAMWLSSRSRPDAPWSGVMLGGPEIAMVPRPSPDGRLVAFQAMVDGQTQVAVMQPDSGDWTVLTRDRTRGVATSMSWSPDGTRIYYGRQDGVPRGVFSVPAVGGEERLVLEDARSPEVLADGSLLVHRLNEKRQPQLYRFWPDGGRLQAYTALP